MPDTTSSTPPKAKTADVKKSSPKLSPAEEAAWWAPSVGMNSFHTSHKRTFNRSYDRADDYDRYGMTLNMYLRESYNLVIHLGNHHRIEEAYIFPMLAHKHPSFRDGAEHKADHEAIHHGLEEYSTFIRTALADNKTYDAVKMRAILDSFREPLMRHLDQEVRDLEPDSLRAHGFTLDEVRRLPF